MVQPGDTWYSQAWCRDALGGRIPCNLTDAVAVTFQEGELQGLGVMVCPAALFSAGHAR